MKKIIINGKSYFCYNVDENKLNYTQRNNEFKWGQKNANAKVDFNSTCNVTSICMALDYAGYKFPKGEFDQPEDNLAKHIIESSLVDKEYASRYPAMYKAYKNDEKGCYTPNEIHKLIEIGTNEWMETKVDTFSDSVPIREIIDDIAIRQLPVVMSGSFPQTKPNGQKVTFFHIICLTGVAFEKEYDGKINPSYYIIDDPWGYTHNYYIGKSGNDVVLTAAQFNAWFKPINNTKIKFAHRFEKPVAVV